MSDEDLEVLVTLDDPWYGPDKDIFNHLQPLTSGPVVLNNGGHENGPEDSRHEPVNKPLEGSRT